MRVVMISEEQDSLLNLLKSITEDSAVLQTTDGQQFLLSPLNSWQGFKITSQRRSFMKI
jgi:hypothetical protein